MYIWFCLTCMRLVDSSSTGIHIALTPVVLMTRLSPGNVTVRLLYHWIPVFHGFIFANRRPILLGLVFWERQSRLLDSPRSTEQYSSIWYDVQGSWSVGNTPDPLVLFEDGSTLKPTVSHWRALTSPQHSLLAYTATIGARFSHMQPPLWHSRHDHSFLHLSAGAGFNTMGNQFGNSYRVEVGLYGDQLYSGWGCDVKLGTDIRTLLQVCDPEQPGVGKWVWSHVPRHLCMAGGSHCTGMSHVSMVTPA